MNGSYDAEEKRIVIRDLTNALNNMRQRAEQAEAALAAAESALAEVREQLGGIARWVESELTHASATIANIQSRGLETAFYAATGMHVAYRATLAKLAAVTSAERREEK